MSPHGYFRALNKWEKEEKIQKTQVPGNALAFCRYKKGGELITCVISSSIMKKIF